MKLIRPRVIVALVVAAIPAACIALLAPEVAAFPFIRDAWQARYPGSATDDNLPTSCQICHRDTNGGEPWNAYGWALKQQLDGGANLDDAFAAIEGADSDQDPTGSTNIEEILASTQPGWTAGPNNTIFFDSGPTENQNPPVLGAGTYDPCPADTDGNSAVDVVDLLALLGAWGPCPAPCPPNCPEDIVPNCNVDVQDLLALLGAWGACPE